MLTIIKDWGVFSPAPVPESFPVKEVGFWQNETGDDWYTSLAHNPTPDSITVIIDPQTDRVLGAHRDPSFLVPHRSRVITVVDDGQDTDDLRGKVWDNGGLLNPPPPVPSAISDRQFAQGLAIEGIISEQEAEEWVGPGTVPAAMLALVNQLPESERFAARMLLRGATQFNRNHPLTEAIGALYSWSPEQIDQFWRDCADL